MAKRRVGVLQALLTLNTSQFSAGTKRGVQNVKLFSAAIGRARRLVSGFAGALGVGLGGVAFVHAIRERAKAIDDLVKTADKLGGTTRGLAGLDFAAEQTGVRIETFHMGLQRMARRLAEAKAGTGEAKAALEELGIDAKTVAELPLEEQFLAIADAMQNVDIASRRLRLGFKLFDSEGVALVNTLALGRRGIEDMMRKAEALGLAIDDNMARRVVVANDKINELRRGLTGLTNEFVAASAPAAEAAAEKLTNFSAKTEQGYLATLRQLQTLPPGHMPYFAAAVRGGANLFGSALGLTPEGIDKRLVELEQQISAGETRPAISRPSPAISRQEHQAAIGEQPITFKAARERAMQKSRESAQLRRLQDAFMNETGSFDVRIGKANLIRDQLLRTAADPRRVRKIDDIIESLQQEKQSAQLKRAREIAPGERRDQLQQIESDRRRRMQEHERGESERLQEMRREMRKREEFDRFLQDIEKNTGDTNRQLERLNRNIENSPQNGVQIRNR